jgi:uncharacterized protein
MLNVIRSISRRGALVLAGAVLATLAVASPAAAQEKKKVLFLTKSSGFQHSAITRKADDPQKPSHAEQQLIELGGKNGFDVTVTKDADVFNDPKTYETYQVIAFYTTLDLTKPSDKSKDGKLLHTEKPMSAEGKAMFLKAIEDGKVGFIGFHSASDTFHSKKTEMVRPAEVKDEVDPYIQMIGGEFKGHGSQQKALMKVTGGTFPGLEGLKDYEMTEEWYNLYNLAPDMHVILVQQTDTMKVDPRTNQRERDYQRPPYPATWAKKWGKGRVFYTSMGHREDVWTNPVFQQVTVAGLNWVSGKTQFEPTPNMKEVAPQPGVAAAK